MVGIPPLKTMIFLQNNPHDIAIITNIAFQWATQGQNLILTSGTSRGFQLGIPQLGSPACLSSATSKHHAVKKSTAPHLQRRSQLGILTKNSLVARMEVYKKRVRIYTKDGELYGFGSNDAHQIGLKRSHSDENMYEWFHLGMEVYK